MTSAWRMLCRLPCITLFACTPEMYKAVLQQQFTGTADCIDELKNKCKMRK